MKINLEKEVDKEETEIIVLDKIDSRKNNYSKSQRNSYVPKLEPLMSFHYYNGLFI